MRATEDEVLEAVIAWIEANRGAIDCSSFKHPTEGPKLRRSLQTAIVSALDGVTLDLPLA